MAMSSGKSNSMAAVLLVVALVGGTCASGAQAKFNFTLRQCKGPVVIRSEKVDFNYTLPNGRSVPVNSSTYAFFVPPVTVTFATKRVRPIEIPEKLLNTLRKEVNTLVEIEIMCDGDTNCINLYSTTKPHGYSSKTAMVGHFCGYFYGAPS